MADRQHAARGVLIIPNADPGHRLHPDAVAVAPRLGGMHGKIALPLHPAGAAQGLDQDFPLQRPKYSQPAAMRSGEGWRTSSTWAVRRPRARGASSTRTRSPGNVKGMNTASRRPSGPASRRARPSPPATSFSMARSSWARVTRNPLRPAHGPPRGAVDDPGSRAARGDALPTPDSWRRRP